MSIIEDDWNNEIGEPLFPTRMQPGQRELLDVVKSETQKDILYEIRMGSDHSIYCTCRGWVQSKADPKRCKHLTHYARLNPEVVRGLVHEGKLLEKYLLLIPGGK